MRQGLLSASPTHLEAGGRCFPQGQAGSGGAQPLAPRPRRAVRRLSPLPAAPCLAAAAAEVSLPSPPRFPPGRRLEVPPATLPVAALAQAIPTSPTAIAFAPATESVVAAKVAQWPPAVLALLAPPLPEAAGIRGLAAGGVADGVARCTAKPLADWPPQYAPGAAQPERRGAREVALSVQMSYQMPFVSNAFR